MRFLAQSFINGIANDSTASREWRKLLYTHLSKYANQIPLYLKKTLNSKSSQMLRSGDEDKHGAWTTSTPAPPPPRQQKHYSTTISKRKALKEKKKWLRQLVKRKLFPEVVKKHHHPLKKKIMPIIPIIQDESTPPPHTSTREERVLRSRTVKLTKQGRLQRRSNKYYGRVNRTWEKDNDQ